MLFRKPALTALSLLFGGLAAAAATELSIPSLAAFERDAVDSVNVTLGPGGVGRVNSMRFKGCSFGEHDPRSTSARDVLRGLSKVEIRSLEFRSGHIYARGDLETLRGKLSAAGWRQFLRVRGRGEGGDVDVFYAPDDHTASAFVVLAAAPHELTLVHAVGRIDFSQIAILLDTFVPREHGRPEIACVDPAGGSTH